MSKIVHILLISFIVWLIYSMTDAFISGYPDHGLIRLLLVIIVIISYISYIGKKSIITSKV